MRTEEQDWAIILAVWNELIGRPHPFGMRKVYANFQEGYRIDRRLYSALRRLADSERYGRAIRFYGAPTGTPGKIRVGGKLWALWQVTPEAIAPPAGT